MLEEADAALAVALLLEVLVRDGDGGEVLDGIGRGGGAAVLEHHVVILVHEPAVYVFGKLGSDGLTEEGLEEPLEGVEVGLELVDLLLLGGEALHSRLGRRSRSQVSAASAGSAVVVEATDERRDVDELGRAAKDPR